MCKYSVCLAHSMIHTQGPASLTTCSAILPFSFLGSLMEWSNHLRARTANSAEFPRKHKRSWQHRML